MIWASLGLVQIAIWCRQYPGGQAGTTARQRQTLPQPASGRTQNPCGATLDFAFMGMVQPYPTGSGEAVPGQLPGQVRSAEPIEIEPGRSGARFQLVQCKEYLRWPGHWDFVKSARMFFSIMATIVDSMQRMVGDELSLNILALSLRRIEPHPGQGWAIFAGWAVGRGVPAWD